MSFIFIHQYYFQIHSTKHDELFDDVAEIMLGNILYLFLIWHLLVYSKHEWTTWAACNQIFEVIQKIKEGEPWKAEAKRMSVEDQKIDKEDLWRMGNTEDFQSTSKI